MKLKRVDIKEFSDYFVSNEGNIYSYKSGEIKKLSTFIDNVGYKQVILYNDNKKRKYFRVHRLVGKFFLEDSYKEGYVINHIDGDKLNNDVKNLEWVSISRNTKHGYEMKLYKAQICKVRAVHKITNKETTFNSIRECSEKLSLNRKTISSILKGKKKTNNYDYNFYYIE